MADTRLVHSAAADVRRNHPDRLEVAFKEIGECGATKVRRLCRRPHRQHIGAAVVSCQHGAAFERHGTAAMKEEFVLEHVCGAGECRLDVAVAHGNDGRDIARQVAVRGRSAEACGFAAVANRRQDLEFDVDRRGGVLREVAVVGDRHRDGLADIADFAACQGELGSRRRPVGASLDASIVA